ncbi:integrase, partial [Bacillus cereus]|nr:integrase [Bacillus cereus]
FVYWFENIWGKHAEDTIFHPIEVTARTITRYREHMQITRLLKPATINRRIHQSYKFSCG